MTVAQIGAAHASSALVSIDPSDMFGNNLHSSDMIIIYQSNQHCCEVIISIGRSFFSPLLGDETCNYEREKVDGYKREREKIQYKN